MKQKNLVMLVVAVGCGLVAAVAVAKLSAGGNKGPETVKVLVAKKDLPLQTKLDEKELDDLLAWADMPKNLVPPDAATDIEQVKGKELNRTLKVGNPVSLTDLGKINRIELPHGYKHLTVKATQVDLAGGFAKPGSRVDIMYVERLNSGKARAAIILRDMLVLAVNMIHTVDEKTGAAIAQVESASFAVNDKQAALLTLAEERGKLKMLLRGTTKADLEQKNNGEIEWVDDPFSSVSTAPPPPPTTIVKEPELQKMVVAKKAIPLNTLINADNLDEFFTTTEVKTVPDGVISTPDDLKGKYIVKAVEAGQIVFKSLTDGKPVEVKVPEPPPPAPPVVVKKKYPRFEQVIQASGRVTRVIWMEVAPNQWKRFDSEKEADDYTPPDEAKGEASKDADSKP